MSNSNSTGVVSRERNWSGLVLEEWLHRLFPSSWSTGYLIRMKSPFALHDGEAFSLALVGHATSNTRGVLFRGFSLLFANGLQQGDHCKTSFMFFLGEQERVTQIVKSYHSRNERGKWVIENDNRYADPAYTEPWKFEEMRNEVEEIVEAFKLLRAERIPQDHPMLSRYNVV